MYLVVGLGNPEKKYLNTFHNIGFLTVDRLADKLGATFDKAECHAVTAHTGGRRKSNNSKTRNIYEFVGASRAGTGKQIQSTP